jgi:hypothetical protein
MTSQTTGSDTPLDALGSHPHPQVGAARTPRNRGPRVLAAVGLVGGMAALWAGSIYHYADTSTAAAWVADTAAHPDAAVVNAATYLAETVFFLLAAIGLAALVRGRGRTFLLAALGVLAVGLPSHAIGATADLVVRAVATSGVPAAHQVAVVQSVQNVQGLYFALVLPFLIGLVLTTAALWRARVVSWQPFALLLGDLVLSQVIHPAGPSAWTWWISPIITIASFAWLAVGVLRYSPEQRARTAEEASAS